MTDPQREVHHRLRPWLYAGVAALFVCLGLAYLIVLFYVYIWPRTVDAPLTRLVTEHTSRLLKKGLAIGLLA